MHCVINVFVPTFLPTICCTICPNLCQSVYASDHFLSYPQYFAVETKLLNFLGWCVLKCDWFTGRCFCTFGLDKSLQRLQISTARRGIGRIYNRGGYSIHFVMLLTMLIEAHALWQNNSLEFNGTNSQRSCQSTHMCISIKNVAINVFTATMQSACIAHHGPIDFTILTNGAYQLISSVVVLKWNTRYTGCSDRR